MLVILGLLLIIALVLFGCSSVSGPCTREVTITTHCETGGTVIIFPSPQ